MGGAWVNANKSHVQELMPELANHMTCRERMDWFDAIFERRYTHRRKDQMSPRTSLHHLWNGMSSSGMMQGPSLLTQ